jgi:hypothetical protein
MGGLVLEELIVGSFMFWLLIGLGVTSLLASAWWESEVIAVLTVVTTLFALAFGFQIDFGAILPHTWYGWTGLAVAFLPLGVMWSMYKFKVEYKKLLLEMWENRFRLSSERDAESQMSAADLNYKRSKYFDDNAPKARLMKGKICFWIIIWPISAFVYVFSDLIKDLVDEIYEYFAGFYERIAMHVKEQVKRQLNG